MTLKKAHAEPPKVEAKPPATGIVLFIGSDVVGRGEDHQLGSLLMEKFLHTVAGLTQKPETILLINNGVKLTAEESLVVGELQQLEAQGVEILACGTCLQRFQLPSSPYLETGKSDLSIRAPRLYQKSHATPLESGVLTPSPQFLNQVQDSSSPLAEEERVVPIRLGRTC